MIHCRVTKIILIGDHEIRLFDHICFESCYPGVSNVIRFDEENQIVWHAELPDPDAIYIAMGNDLETIWCGTANSIVCNIDLATGFIVKRHLIS